MTFKIIYTSDVHGQITASNYALNKKAPQGLTRLATYLKSIKEPYLLLDNGDFLQGNILLDYYRKYSDDDTHPMVRAFNTLGYDYINLGNHDFNYGQKYLNDTLSQLKPKILCANITDQQGKNIYTPYVIKNLNNEKRIGIIGVITQYIPHWEKPEHITGLSFLDAYKTAQYYVNEIRQRVDYLIVLYHGGFEKDFNTHQPIGRTSDENMGYKIAQIPGVDLLLCGHQHMPAVHHTDAGTIVMQTTANAKNFGRIDIDFSADSFKHEALLVDNEFSESQPFNALFDTLETKTQLWLDQPIGKTSLNMTIESQLDARKTKHPMFQLINNAQMALTHADISAASLPNEALGFKKTIKLRDIAANFIYPNTIQVLEVTGKNLKAALERTAEYFAVESKELTIDADFTFPKIEHYNYDIYDGITYVFDIRKPKGHRLIEANFKDKPLDDKTLYTIALSNYRAQGGGDYYMYENAKLIREYTTSLFDLVVDYIEQTPELNIKVIDNFHLIY